MVNGFLYCDWNYEMLQFLDPVLRIIFGFKSILNFVLYKLIEPTLHVFLAVNFSESYLSTYPYFINCKDEEKRWKCHQHTFYLFFDQILYKA